MKARMPGGYGRPDMNSLMRQAQKMQSDMQAKQAELEQTNVQLEERTHELEARQQALLIAQGQMPKAEALAERLAEGYEIVILTEEGGGVIPADPAQRAAREKAGRLACLLAARAGCVVRVFCGLPLVLKGECKL